MTEENIFMRRELIVMIGITASGKSFYVNRNYINDHQYVSETHIAEGIRRENIPFDENIKNMIMAVAVRSFMIRGLPIIIDEQNLDIESLFIWKKFAVDHDYSIKGVLVDTPLEVCIDRLESILKDNFREEYKKKLSEEYDKLEELKTILSMKYQKILDEVEYIKYGGKKL